MASPSARTFISRSGGLDAARRHLEVLAGDGRVHVLDGEALGLHAGASYQTRMERSR